MPPPARQPGESPAARRARQDADAAWPERSRASDGIMGDAAHQARPSDHNLGNAIDITHDPAHGADGPTIAELALTDARVTYVIHAGRIWHRTRHDREWRPYGGANPHRTHVHISIRADMRDDDQPWPWSPDFNPYA